MIANGTPVTATPAAPNADPSNNNPPTPAVITPAPATHLPTPSSKTKISPSFKVCCWLLAC